MYGNPNPCLNRGSCEEGIAGPICKCRGFIGAYCNIDINECAKNPCLNGGQCINTYGSFRCMCPQNATGPYCDVQARPVIDIALEEVRSRGSQNLIHRRSIFALDHRFPKTSSFSVSMRT